MITYISFCNCKAADHRDLLTDDDVCRYCGTRWVRAASDRDAFVPLYGNADCRPVFCEPGKVCPAHRANVKGA